ncbi:MAG: pilus assembly PilX family protein [Pseudomonas sp.]
MSRAICSHVAIVRRRQRGVSLVLVLILLVVMSILGIAVLRSSAMQERMTANLRDRSLAFQAAETALRFAQEDVLGNDGISDLQYGKTLQELRTAGKPVTCATHGICDQTLATPETPVARTAPDGRSTYTIEYLGTGKGSQVQGVCETTAGAASYQCQRPMFRVTARGRSPGQAEVVLQANVISR